MLKNFAVVFVVVDDEHTAGLNTASKRRRQSWCRGGKSLPTHCQLMAQQPLRTIRVNAAVTPQGFPCLEVTSVYPTLNGLNGHTQTA
jgi:hypothetical protein